MALPRILRDMRARAAVSSGSLTMQNGDSEDVSKPWMGYRCRYGLVKEENKAREQVAIPSIPIRGIKGTYTSVVEKKLDLDSCQGCKRLEFRFPK